MDNIYVTKPFLPPISEYFQELEKIWDIHILSNGGPEYIKFNNLLKEYLNIDNISMYTNGHLSLEMAIKSLNLSGEVITTPFTFISTTHAIVNNNLTPVFCDIKMEDYTIDENKIEKLITPKTSAIIPVHVYGYPCNVSKIEQIAKKYNLKVIYDAAHAFGVKINNHSIFEFGDLIMCSFHATKLFHTIEGGMIAGKDEELIHKIDILKNYGITSPETIDEVGINGKMSEFQAAMGITIFKYIEDIIKRRKEITLKYRKELSEIKGIKFYHELENIKYTYAYMPILINEEEYGMNRDKLYDLLQNNNIFSRKYFYPLTSDVQCYHNMYKNDNLDVARYVSNNILTLPLYPDLKDEQVNKIIKIIKEKK